MDKAAVEAFIQRRHTIFLRLLALRSLIKVLQGELEVTLAEVDNPSIGDDAKEHPEITSRVVEACHHLGIDADVYLSPSGNATTSTGPVASSSNATTSVGSVASSSNTMTSAAPPPSSSNTTTSAGPVASSSGNATTSAGPVASTSNANQGGNTDESDSDDSIEVYWSCKRQIEVLGMTEAEYHSA